MMYADRMTAEDIANLSDQRPNRINVFKRASKIKTWNMFIHLVEQENITPADALTIILKHLKQSTTAWKKYKIAGDPDQVGAIWMLLEWQDKIGSQVTKKSLGKVNYIGCLSNVYTLSASSNIWAHHIRALLSFSITSS